jgi:hypothetical protein
MTSLTRSQSQGKNAEGGNESVPDCLSHCRIEINFMKFKFILEYVTRTNGEVNISHENTTMVVWIYSGV